MLVCHIQALQNDLNMLETSCVSVTFRKYRKCILYNDSCVDYLITLSVGTYISYAALYVLQTCILIAACGFVFVLILIGVFTMLRNRYKAAVNQMSISSFVSQHVFAVNKKSNIQLRYFTQKK